MQKNFIADYIKKGYSFFNTGTHEKKCFTKWSQYQDRHPTPNDITNWSTWSTKNWAIVTGEISNLIVFDVDTKNGADPTPFLNLGMYEVRTPSGGYHFYCQYDPLLPSTNHKKRPNKGILFAVDIQSNKALVFAPPSAFPNGAYTVVNDVPVGKIPEDLLIKVLEALEPEAEDTDPKPYVPQTYHLTGEAKPGDIFNALATWDDVLLPLGWTKVGQPTQMGRQFWRRPGKTDGISASTNYKGYDLMFCYSSSVDMKQHKGHRKFSALVSLKYGGDPQKAARALVLESINKGLASNYKK